MITRNQIFTKVKTAILAAYSTAYCTSTRVYAPSRFPCVWIVEIDTYPEKSSMTVNYSDDQRRSTFEIQVFSNLSDEAWSQTDGIMGVAVATMKSLGYRCTMNQPVDNGVDSNIKRRVARFTRFIGSGDTLPTEN